MQIPEIKHHPFLIELLKHRPAMYNSELDYVEEQARLGHVLSLVS